MSLVHLVVEVFGWFALGVAVGFVLFFSYIQWSERKQERQRWVRDETLEERCLLLGLEVSPPARAEIHRAVRRFNRIQSAKRLSVN